MVTSSTLNDLLSRAAAEFETRHGEQNVAHNVAISKQALGDQLDLDNQAGEKTKTERLDIVTALTTEKAHLAEAERSLSALEASQASIASSGAQGASDHKTVRRS